MSSAPSARPITPPLNVATILTEGFIAGIVGAGIVALWFLFLDWVQREPLYTLSLLGTLLFKGADAAVGHESVDPGMVAAYTIVHHVAFVVVGVIASYLVTEMERVPPLGIALVFLFVSFETGFHIFMLAVGQPLLGAIAFWGVAVANLLAAGGMAAYLWYRHPRLLVHFDRIWDEG